MQHFRSSTYHPCQKANHGGRLAIQPFRRALQQDITATGSLAEENMAGIASAATAVVIGHAAATRTMRVGAGGIMLPNHAPLIANSLNAATLYGDRNSACCAPGTDMATSALCAAIWRPRIAFPKMCKS
jgi:hypothetical protein